MSTLFTVKSRIVTNYAKKILQDRYHFLHNRPTYVIVLGTKTESPFQEYQVHEYCSLYSRYVTGTIPVLKNTRLATTLVNNHVSFLSRFFAHRRIQNL
jgi:hypothetical protein